MIVDGEKYACDACIRGHRVSSCTHKDRKLHHVNKKGRPLTQCPHCRGLRKSRAAHVKCDCGEIGLVRTTSSDSGAEAACKCPTGKRCTCALKKEHYDIGDLHRSKSCVQKPKWPVHHSDSAVPRIKAPVYPPAHRVHHAHHDHSQPHAIVRSRALTESLHRSQPSFDGPNATRYGSPQPSAAAPMLQRQYSNPTYSSPSPRPRPALPPLRVASQSPMPDFSSSLDMSRVYNALSPGNPARYSFHDLTEFSMDSMSRHMPQDMFMVNDEWAEPSQKWPQSDMPHLDENGYARNEHPVTPSDVSVEHSLSSQFGMSSSGSEHGDTTAQPSDYASRDLPFRMTPSMAPAAEINNGKAMAAPPSWLYDMPAYAASDPGLFNPNNALPDNMNFNLEGLQGPPDLGSGDFLNDDMEQYELTMPMMTEDAVRDWVPNPAQMQDPNYAFEVPTQYLPPMMEGNYGWI